LRLIIQECFGISTYSKYPEEKYAWLFGEEAKTFGKQWSQDFIRKCEDSEKIFPIKTHEVPPLEDTSSIIYIARDGRDACVSLSRLWGTPLRIVVGGIVTKIVDGGRPVATIGSWSEHWQAWRSRLRESDKVIRFEQMLTKPDRIAKEIAPMFGLKAPLYKFTNKFEYWRSRDPHFFRSGRIGSWKDEFTLRDEKIFWEEHGWAMRELGYS
jgi:hypothetical protein